MANTLSFDLAIFFDSNQRIAISGGECPRLSCPSKAQEKQRQWREYPSFNPHRRVTHLGDASGSCLSWKSPPTPGSLPATPPRRGMGSSPLFHPVLPSAWSRQSLLAYPTHIRPGSRRSCDGVPGPQVCRRTAIHSLIIGQGEAGIPATGTGTLVAE